MTGAALPGWARETLRCPADKAVLVDSTGPTGEPELVCSACSLAYPVRDGIPVLLVDDARRP